MARRILAVLLLAMAAGQLSDLTGFVDAVEAYRIGGRGSAWAFTVPIAWPAPARVIWWLAVAGAAGLFRLGLHRLGFGQRLLIVVASIGPFVAFAIGIATGSSWSTWH